MMHKVSLVQLLPASYDSAHQGRGRCRGRSRRRPGSARGFATSATSSRRFRVDPEVYLDIYPEYRLAEEQRQGWFADRTAPRRTCHCRHLGWKVGDQMPLKSAIWRRRTAPIPGTSPSARSTTCPRPAAPGNILLHTDYFEEVEDAAKGLVGWYVVRISDPATARRDRARDRRAVRELAGRDRDLHREGLRAGLRQPDR